MIMNVPGLLAATVAVMWAVYLLLFLPRVIGLLA